MPDNQTTLTCPTFRVWHGYRNTCGDWGHGYHRYGYGIGIWHTAAYHVPAVLSWPRSVNKVKSMGQKVKVNS